MITRLIFFLLFLPHLLIASNIPDEVIEKTGMFGMCNYIISILAGYEKREISSFKVDFKDKGLFYEEAKGPNWWSYYFEPIDLTPRSKERTQKQIPLSKLPLREANHALIQKYIKIKPFLFEKAARFQKENFKTPFTIGVHYRGTDKKEEYPRTPFFFVKNKIKDAIAHFKLKNYQIFVATDEVDFIHYLQKEFGPKVIYAPAVRSETQDPIHFQSDKPFLLGQEAIVDAILLSKCQYLIRTQSNLSAFSTFLNPHLQYEIVGVPRQR